MSEQSKMLTLDDVRAIIDAHMQSAISDIEAMLMPDTVEVEDEPMPEVDVAELYDEELPIETAAYDDDEDKLDEDDKPLTLVGRMGKALARFLATNPDDEPSAFQVVKTKDGRFAWFARWSNNFKDRDGEWFSGRAIKQYVARVDAGLVEPPELWAIHTPGTRHGKAELVAQVGNFVVSAGYFDDTTLGRRAAERYAKMKGLGMSHGFVFNPDRLVDNVYHDFNTFEISVLPRKLASNPYTTFEELKAMSLNDEKRAFLKDIFGDAVDSIIEDTEKASKALAEAGVAFKDFASLEGGEETTQVKDAAANAQKNFTQLVGDLINGQAELANQLTSAVKAYEDVLAVVTEQGEELKALRAQLDNRPRIASSDNATAVNTDKLPEAIKDAIKASSVERDDFFGVEVRK